MKVVKRHSYKDGENYLKQHHPGILEEVISIIECIDAESCRIKEPKNTEISKARRHGVDRFYSPPHINALFDYCFFNLKWDLKPRINTNEPVRQDSFREMDVLKDRVGVEIQIGKYAFLTYDIIAKMVIFKNYGVIDCGIEICPTTSMLPFMSTGIGALEQVVWDLESRGVADIDIPVVLLGVEPESMPKTTRQNKSMAKTQPAQPPLAGLIDPSERVVGVIVTGRYKSLSPVTLAKIRETGLSV